MMEAIKNAPQTAATQTALRSPSGKKPYEPPQMLYRAPLEAMASVCTPAPNGVGKAFPGVGGCDETMS